MYAEIKFNHNWLIKRAINEKVRGRLPDFSGLVLDLGCGSRPFESDILLHASRYVGVDWGNSLHRSQADIISDLNKPLPIDSNHVDHIDSFEVMEHLSEPRVMLTEAFRVLRSGGQLSLSVPLQWWVHEAPLDYYRCTRYGLHYMLDQAGFVNVSIEATTGFWAVWILKLNYQTTRLIRGSRLVRILSRAALAPFWWVNQHLASMMDRWWPEDRETAGYFVTASKP